MLRAQGAVGSFQGTAGHGCHGIGVKTPGLWLQPLTLPWVICIISLNLSSFICKIRLVIIRLHKNKAWPKVGISEWNLLYYFVVVHMLLLILLTMPYSTGNFIPILQMRKLT